ncbi:MAG: GGDEF domain-containing protein, partial [Lachnospiraceae bacterium]|nr:GGDEF domain-containing protein [Lachnospiraceae bacterium]
TVARIRNVGKVDTGLITGFALALVFAVLELVRYNVAKFGTGFKDNKYNSTIGIAALIVVITLFADYLSKVTRNIAREAEAQAFEKMAYMDELTGILNRRGLEKPMQLFKNTKSLYALVSVDMNLLKMMNDTYGHATGDRALSLLAKKLTEAYPEPCTVARTGGDEFVVAIPHTTRDWVERHTCIFLERLYEHNLKGENVTLSAAYGIAYSDEAASPEEVLALADERMYAKKKESKMQRE